MINSHWDFFLAIDSDFGLISRYIVPCKHNKNVFSLELARILMTATQECDVIPKSICIRKGNTTNKEGDYRSFFNEHYPRITDIKICSPRFKMDFIPFKSWKDDITPAWLSANNKIKHNRSTEFRKAILSNTMLAISGLYVVNLYYYMESNQVLLRPSANFFKPDLDTCGATTINDYTYKIPTD